MMRQFIESVLNNPWKLIVVAMTAMLMITCNASTEPPAPIEFDGWTVIKKNKYCTYWVKNIDHYRTVACECNANATCSIAIH